MGTHRSERHGIGRTAALLFGAAAALAVLAIAAPGLADDLQLSWFTQSLAQAAATIACLRAIPGAQRLGRLAWGLLAAGQAMWGATNLVYGIALATGAAIGDVSAFDIFWLAYYLPTLGAVGILYHRMQPEPGWLGVIDALVLVGAASLACWAWVVTPIAGADTGGTVSAAVNGLYSSLDLLGLCVLAWLVLRRRATPRWTVPLVAFFGMSVAAGLFYLPAVLFDSQGSDGISGALYTASSTFLLIAARRRRLGGAWARPEQARATTPPEWSLLVPFLPVFPVIAILLDDRTMVVHVLAVGVILVVIGRLSWSLLVLGRMGHQHQHLMRIDVLTGAYNRLFLSEELGRLVARARRDEAELAAITLDLDGFKMANDTLGHAVGDALLARFVAEAHDRLRAGDVLCRLGGDEFVALLPGTDAPGALALADRFLEGLERARQAISPAVPVTGSIGVAVQRGADIDGDHLLRQADEAMYAAKRAGGGRVLTWRPEPVRRSA